MSRHHLSHHYFYRLIALAFCSTLLACSTKPTNVNYPIKTFAWNTPVPSPQGKVVITYQLPQHARADFLLLKQKKSHQSTALASIKLSNENCLKGHQAALGHGTGNGEFYTKYFTKELDWSNHNTISIRWTSNKSIEVTTNSETLSVPIPESSKTLQVISYYAPIEIQHVEYLSE
jgi:hypothetical protein